MKTKAQIDTEVKQIFEAYQKEFGGEGFADNDILQIIKRTMSRRKVEFLDKAIDKLELTEADLNNYIDELSAEKQKHSKMQFEEHLANKEYADAEYVINSYKSVWSEDERRSMAKRIGEAYDINPYSQLVDTLHNIRKEIKKKGALELLEKYK